MSDEPAHDQPPVEQEPGTTIEMDLAERLGGIQDPAVLAAVAQRIKEAAQLLVQGESPATPDRDSPKPAPRPGLESRAIQEASRELDAAHRERVESRKKFAEQQRNREDHLNLAAFLANRVQEISGRRPWWANVREWLIDATAPVDRQVTECKGPFTLTFKILHHGLKKWERGAMKYDVDLNEKVVINKVSYETGDVLDSSHQASQLIRNRRDSPSHEGGPRREDSADDS